MAYFIFDSKFLSIDNSNMKRARRAFIIILTIINLLVATMTILASYGGHVNPTDTAIPAIVAMTLPIWLLMLIVMLIIDCFASKRLCAIPVLTAIVCWNPIAQFCPIHPTRNHTDKYPSDSCFTLLTYNVMGFKDYETDTVYPYHAGRELMEQGGRNRTIDFILNQRPDILCLQEGLITSESPSILLTQSQVDSIKARLPFTAATEGECIMTAYDAEPITLRQPDSDYAWFGAAKLNIMGHETLVVSVHLQSIGLDNNDKTLYREITDGEARHKMHAVKQQLLSKLASAFKRRAQQARLLREQIDSLGIENVIVAGDFNDITDCYALRTIGGTDFKNAFREAGCGPEITYHANRFYFHIDHILYRGQMELVSYERIKVPFSDHYPLSAVFTWRDDEQ